VLCSKTVAETVMDLAYQIVVAHNGCEALQILRESHKIDLLFSDRDARRQEWRPAGIEARRLKPASTSY
jgi:CheY-like chemotaxis protein